MKAVTMRAPVGARDRLAQARLALRLAEERTGLRDSAALEVQRAVSSATTSTSRGAATAAADPPQAASLTGLATTQDSGVLNLQGSATLLLAALALRQGSVGWCAVVGGDELGWCAAAEVGLDLNRVLTVPASVLDDASALTVVSALLDGVGALLIGAPVAERLRPQHRRRLLARARERGCLPLTPEPWVHPPYRSWWSTPWSPRWNPLPTASSSPSGEGPQQAFRRKPWRCRPDTCAASAGH